MSWRELWIALALFLTAMAAAHYPLFLSGFQRISGDYGDTVLVNWVLEHDWGWLVRDPLHAHFWDAPYFFPEPFTAGYTHLLLGLMPLYAPLRACGMEPQTALQITILLCSVLNFAAAYWFLRRVAGIGPMGTAAGALFFTFASPRLQHVTHVQLIPQFYIVLSVAGLWLLFQQGPVIPRDAVWRALALFSAVVAQVYTDIYYAFFLCLALASAAVIAGSIRTTRASLLAVLRRHWGPVAVTMLLDGLLLLPCAWGYGEVFQKIGGRPFETTRQFLPTMRAWFYHGANSWLYGWTRGMVRPSLSADELRIGTGFLTLALALYAAIQFRRWIPVRIVAGTALALILLTTIFPGDLTLWAVVFKLVPPARAVRAVARVGLFLLLAEALLLALAMNEAARSRRRWLAPLLLFLVMAEQAVSQGSYSKEYLVRMSDDWIVRWLPTGCQSILFSHDELASPYYHTVPMWAGVRAHLPTLNGYSGNNPPQYPFSDTTIRDRMEAVQRFHALRSWMDLHPALANVCWVLPGTLDPALLRRADVLSGVSFRSNELFLRLLGRFPNANERAVFRENTGNPARIVEQVIATPEFTAREVFVLAVGRIVNGTDVPYPEWLAQTHQLASRRATLAELVDRVLAQRFGPNPAVPEVAAAAQQNVFHSRDNLTQAWGATPQAIVLSLARAPRFRHLWHRRLVETVLRYSLTDGATTFPLSSADTKRILEQAAR